MGLLLSGCADSYTKFQKKHGTTWRYAWVKSPTTGKSHFAGGYSYLDAENEAKKGCRERGI